MQEWFNDEEVNDLLTKLMDRLCTLERTGGEAFESTLVLIPRDKQYPILYAQNGKPFPPDNMTYQDIELDIKVALKIRLRDKE
jgi:hypothetical protein